MKTPCAVLLLACCVFMGGCAIQSRQMDVAQMDRLKPGDLISIYFLGENKMISDPPFPISDNGLVVMPISPFPIASQETQENGSQSLIRPVEFIGPIEIAGLTTTQAAAKIHDAYVPKYFPELTVIVKKVESP